MTSIKDDGLLFIGKTVGLHGNKGIVKAILYVDDADIFQPDEAIWIETAAGLESYTIVSIQSYKNIFRLGLEGINNREQAQVIVGAKLYFEKEKLPEAEEGAYYWFDLLGTTVYTNAGRLLGKIEEIIETGSNDVYVVRNRNQKPFKEILIPAIAAVVISVDIDKKTMEVDLPEGLE
jgi:16S rRNA processing protein RimM